MSGWKFTRGDVAVQCMKYGPMLHLDGIVDAAGNALDGVLVMYAFALNESIHEKDGTLSCQPRFEEAYWSGRYSQSPYQAELNQRFGKDGPCSYGNWQVMLCNTGFRPEEFESCEIGAMAFLGHLNRAIAAQKPKTLRDLGDLYNSGNCHDRNEPLEYMDRLERNYRVPMPEPEAACDVSN